MVFIDIHTHNTTAADHAIYNSGTSYLAGRHISMGIHPWYIGDKWEEELATIANFAKAANVVAIGECGMDYLKSAASRALQEKIFKAHIELSEKLGKPLIIHCVKAHERLIALCKERHAVQPWIIHGFRGKPEQAQQLTRAGFYISLGEHFNIESARAIPGERLFIESDESCLPISSIYSSIAAARGKDIDELAAQISSNAHIFEQF